MNAWMMLALAIAFEVAATSLLKVSDGFSRWGPAVSALLLYGLSFYLLAQIFRSLPVGLVYAVWSGGGVVLTALIAWVAFGQKIDTAGCIGIAMIIGGVAVINLFSSSVH
ncbi:multidrug efflux SMR transporter [Neisseria sp.]|uniref:DMT family transporter n=1 Tax=Neisseria sp. TaxID=192066 RepID=UPI0028A16B9A|nr:multidrug efflux SMR transporter [Neisseria sp.]